MKTVRIKERVVEEIIPDYALPVEAWYGAEFAAHCMEAPDAVEQGWVYDGAEFSRPAPPPKPEPPEPAPPTLAERVEGLEQTKAEKTELDAIAAAIEKGLSL